jgi:hypothetical protein
MSEADPMRWVWRGVAGATLVLGWLFILWQNKFHITVPVVVIGLGYLAVVATISNLWRVGAAAVAPEDNSPDAWARPIGARGELEKEKKTLLRAIKEAEFDQAMGKLSQADADELIRMYRARAIELIKEIDRIDEGHASTAREQIQREVQARLAVDKDKPAKKGKKGGKGEDKAADKAEAKAGDTTEAKADTAEAKGGDQAAVDAKADDANAADAPPADEAPTDTKPTEATT